MKKKKPGPAEIAAATPLTKALQRPADPMTACNVCGLDSAELRAWREHDERDQPIEGIGALVFIGGDHPDCIKVMEIHPRLYAEVRGMPGYFPALCGPCVSRSGLACSHPDLKANGGAGLYVTLSGFAAGAILCGRGGCRTMPTRATACVGQRKLKAV
ncbi:MAG: hypothetical protein EPN98_21735 [Phenylobacterium sp.]|uniref:hypothetical protein n=1 Tax=Phenylobacterium sp. TaxID=1871053 RepID=UPI001205FB2B|nr:hypothetical protein [Phenylobacterium sp.]TAL29066.1 MAG: hypothetical protein EPN98_21735 [Phenylobacterium sp.]